MSRYRTIVADPPWPYQGRMSGTLHGSRRPERTTMASAEMPYGTLSVAEIAALPVLSLAADDAHLYLWTTQRFMRDAYTVLDAWGFSASAILVWSG